MPRPKLRAIVGPVLALALFILAVRLLLHEAKHITWQEFKTGIESVRPLYLMIAAILVTLNYVLYTSYDVLGIRYLCRSLPLRRVALASFVGFSLGNNIGTLLAGSPIRFRFYSRWGLQPAQIVVLISMLGLSFWSGVWFLGGIVLILVPLELPEDVNIPFGTQTMGIILFLLFIGYFVACCVYRKPWPLGKLHLRLPRPGLMTLQTSVASLDLFISATALYLVLPGSVDVPFAPVLAAFLVGISIALLTQVPGGIGILEAILVLLLKTRAGESSEISGEAAVLGAVLIFRVMYYFVPLLIGMVALVAHEIYEGVGEASQARRVVLEGGANPIKETESEDPYKPPADHKKIDSETKDFDAERSSDSSDTS